MSKYSITQHFYERLNTRFNVPKADAQDWVHRYFSHAVKIHTERNDKSVKYSCNNIIVVSDDQEMALITCYYERPDADSKILLASPEVKSLLTRTIHSYQKHVTQRTAKNLKQELFELAKLNQKLANARNFKYVDAYNTQIAQINAQINNEYGKQDEVLTELQKVLDTFK